jgi:hypothetical protein
MPHGTIVRVSQATWPRTGVTSACPCALATQPTTTGAGPGKLCRRTATAHHCRHFYWDHGGSGLTLQQGGHVPRHRIPDLASYMVGHTRGLCMAMGPGNITHGHLPTSRRLPRHWRWAFTRLQRRRLLPIYPQRWSRRIRALPRPQGRVLSRPWHCGSLPAYLQHWMYPGAYLRAGVGVPTPLALDVARHHYFQRWRSLLQRIMPHGAAVGDMRQLCMLICPGSMTTKAGPGPGKLCLRIATAHHCPHTYWDHGGPGLNLH